MKTALLLTNSAATHRLFVDVLGQNTNLVLLPAPTEPSREKFDTLFAPWLRLADAVILDAASLGAIARAGVESLAGVAADERPAVVVRATEQQHALLPAGADWLAVADTDAAEQLREALGSFFELRDAKAKLKRADAIIARVRQASPSPAAAPRPASAPQPSFPHVNPGFDTYRYRDALKYISHVLSQPHDAPTLLREFARLVRELLGVGKLAIFMRPFHNDWLGGALGPGGGHFALATGMGVAPNVATHLRLTLDAGIGHFLATEARVLRRVRANDPNALDFDPQIVHEFELLGTEVAVPIFDNDQLLGVLTCSGKITGEPIVNEELELAYHLMTELAQAIRNIQLSAQVAAQQRFMSEVLAHVSSGVVVVGDNRRILNINARARQLLALGPDEMLGQDIGRLPAPVAEVVIEALRSGEEIYQSEVELADNPRPLGISATRFAATTFGGGLAAVALIEDLTQLKREEQHARAAADQEFFTRLSSRMSHELKNSLVSIKIFAQLLPERFNDKEFREQFSNVVVNQVNRVDALVNNLTFFGQPLTLVCEPLPVSELIDQCIENLRDELGRKQLAHIVDIGGKKKASDASPAIPVVQIRREYKHRAARVEGDKIRLQQAFDHIVRNAVQSMPQGGRLTISTSDATLPAGGAVRIEWSDTGEGIAPEHLRRVTEPFVTTRNVGVGLGLTIVKKIVEQHGGRLEIESVPGRGATMVTLLPLHVLPLPAEGGAAAPVLREDSTTTKRG